MQCCCPCPGPCHLSTGPGPGPCMKVLASVLAVALSRD